MSYSNGDSLIKSYCWRSGEPTPALAFKDDNVLSATTVVRTDLAPLKITWNITDLV